MASSRWRRASGSRRPSAGLVGIHRLRRRPRGERAEARPAAGSPRPRPHFGNEVDPLSEPVGRTDVEVILARTIHVLVPPRNVRWVASFASLASWVDDSETMGSLSDGEGARFRAGRKEALSHAAETECGDLQAAGSSCVRRPPGRDLPRPAVRGAMAVDGGQGDCFTVRARSTCVAALRGIGHDAGDPQRASNASGRMSDLRKIQRPDDGGRPPCPSVVGAPPKPPASRGAERTVRRLHPLRQSRSSPSARG
jgi:hypothetical protein